MIWLSDPPFRRIADSTARDAYAAQYAARGVRPFFIMYGDFPRRMSGGSEIAAVNQSTSPYFDVSHIIDWLVDDATAMTGVATSRRSPNRMAGWDPTGAAEQWLMIDIEGTFLSEAWAPGTPEREKAIELIEAIRAAIPNVRVTWYGTPHIISSYNQNFTPHRDALFAAGVPFNTAPTPLPLNAMFADSRLRATLFQIHEEYGDEVIDGLAEYFADRQAEFTRAMDWISPVAYPSHLPSASPPASSGSSIVSQRFTRDFRELEQRWVAKTTARAAARCRRLGRLSVPLVPLTYFTGTIETAGYWDGGTFRFQWNANVTAEGSSPARFAYAESDGSQLLAPPVGTMSGGCSSSVGVANCLWFNQSDYYSRRLAATYTGQTTTIDGATIELWAPNVEVNGSTPKPAEQIANEFVAPFVEEGANAVAVWQPYAHNGIPGTAAPTDTNGRNRAWTIGQELLGVDHMAVYAAEGRFHLTDAEMAAHVASEFGASSSGWTWTSDAFRQFLYGRASQVLLDRIDEVMPYERRARLNNAARQSTIDSGGIVIGTP